MHDIAPENPNSGPIKNWLGEYTNYSDALKELTSELAAQAETILYTEPLIQGIFYFSCLTLTLLDANQLLDDTTKITNELFQLGEAKTESENPTEVVEVVEKASRNKTAIIIRNRIKEKLEGSDPDKNITVTVSQQVFCSKISKFYFEKVDYVVTESRAIHNLALMYEGWTSWV